MDFLASLRSVCWQMQKPFMTVPTGRMFAELLEESLPANLTLMMTATGEYRPGGLTFLITPSFSRTTREK